MKDVIEIEKAVVVRGGRIVLDRASLSVQKNEFVGICGANGAGKTTLLHLVNGLVACSSGRVRVFGDELDRAALRFVRTRIGYVPQQFDTDYGIPASAGDVVLMGCYGRVGLFRAPGADRIEAARGFMDALGVGQLFRRPFGHISGGERQKVMIARALMQEPEILLLDEPFSSLSEEAERLTVDLIRRFHRERQLTTVMISHERQILENLCDRIVTVEYGKLRFHD